MVATSAAAGSFYAVIQAPPDLSWIVEHERLMRAVSRTPRSMGMAIATGATIGGLISSCIIGFELFGEARWFERGGRRLPLAAAMLLRTIVYGVVIMAALLLVPWVYSGEQPSLYRPGIVGDVVFSIAATFVFVSLTSIVQLIGPNVLGSLLTGRYYHPREEQRIVVFLDLVGSTGIAEAIGNVRFHALLSETFTRLSRDRDRLRWRSASLRWRRIDRDLAARHAAGERPRDPTACSRAGMRWTRRVPICCAGMGTFPGFARAFIAARWWPARSAASSARSPSSATR